MLGRLLLAFALGMAGPAVAVQEQACDVPAVARALEKRLQILFPQGEDQRDLMGMVCKANPQKPGQTLVALFHALKGKQGQPVDGEAGFVVAVVDTVRGTVASLYRDTIADEATIRVWGGGLAIDTGRYDLAPRIRAIGVRMAIGHGPRCAEGGANNFLTLFVQEGLVLRPVLKDLPLTMWRLQDGWNPACSATEMPHGISTAQVVLAMGRGTSHGWRDIEVRARVTTERFNAAGEEAAKPRVRLHKAGTLQYDGRSYPGELWGLVSNVLE